VAQFLNGTADYICQAYIREQEEVKKVEIAGKVQQMMQRTGKREYCLRVGSHPIFSTGFRLPVGREKDLPDSLVNPDYSKIAALIKG
jgi:hypothetical protein